MVGYNMDTGFAIVAMLGMEGTGEADTRLGRTSLHLHVAPGIPTGFDPALSQRICNFALSGYTAAGSVDTSLRDVVDRKLFVRPARVGRIFDAAGEEIVRLEALTTMAVDGGIITVTNWMTGFSRLPCPVAESWGDETLLPAGPSRATSVTHFVVRLEDGSLLDGLTVVPYQYDRAHLSVTPAIRSIIDDHCKRVSATEVLLSAVSEWKPLSVSPTSVEL